MTTAAILTAAGSGSRFGATVPKALVELAGVPLVVHAARRLAASGVIDLIVVTVPADFVAEFRAVIDGVVDGVVDVPVKFVVGRASRQGSVAAALEALPPEVDVVLVHDAARPLAPGSLIARVVAAVRSGSRAVIPALAVTDTIVEVEVEVEVEAGAGADYPGVAGGGGSATPRVRVVSNPDRAALRIVQTPQGFDRAVLDRAHAAAAHRAGDETSSATDDASLVAALGELVHVVPGDADAAKITTPRDLAVAELGLAGLGLAELGLSGPR